MSTQAGKRGQGTGTNDVRGELEQSGRVGPGRGGDGMGHGRQGEGRGAEDNVGSLAFTDGTKSLSVQLLAFILGRLGPENRLTPAKLSKLYSNRMRCSVPKCESKIRCVILLGAGGGISLE